MARKSLLARIFIYMMLELGSLTGVAMTPEQIETLTRTMNGTQVVAVARRDADGDPPEPDSPEPER